MEEHQGKNRISFTGEVVETCQREGKTLATVALKSICVEIDAEAHQDVHLGDQVIIEAHLDVQSVQQHFEGDSPSHPAAKAGAKGAS